MGVLAQLARTEPRRTADVTGRQHPVQLKPEGVICLCSKNSWLKRVLKKKVRRETPKIKEGKPAAAAPGGRGDGREEKRKKQWPSFQW